MSFSLGYNQDFLGFSRLLASHGEKVGEVYFPLPSRIGSSGRAEFQPDTYPNEIKQLVKLCSGNGIKSCLLLNASCEGKHIGDLRSMYRIVDYVKELEKLGLEAVIATNPLYLMLLGQEAPGLELQASVNCYCQTVEHARHLQELGATVLTVDRDINRDLDRIRRIKATGLKIKVLLNEGCLLDCPFRKMHFNQIAHINPRDPGEQAAYIRFRCMACVSILERRPEICFKSPFIRPEDLWRYQDLADYFKIASRTTPTEVIERRLEAYSKESFDGNLISLFETAGVPKVIKRIDNKKLDRYSFFEKISSCEGNCAECGYCTKLLKETAELWDRRLRYSERTFPTPRDLCM
ncbi:MAG: U32 family peptidase [Candidatus Bathyarchaeia archaeon]